MKKLFLITIALLLGIFVAQANNIVVSNVSLNGQNATSHFSLVNYNVTWDNSWRTSTNESNYDGAWIFVKFRKANTSEWKHATLNTAGFTAPTGSTIKVSSDNKGLWIYRNANGMGTVNFTGAKIRWDYGADGVLDNDSVEVKVFAMEMVYIPQGAFYLGSGGTGTGEFRQGVTVPNTPYLVNSAGSITIGNTAGNLFYTSGTATGDALGPIPATFPNGYNAFWLMKYEMSQQQMVDFLNHLDQTKATAHFPGSYTGISGTFPNYVASLPEKALPYGSSWKTLKAYADWTGMRPYTELEFEKACRGANITPIADEYPWGNTSIYGVSTLVNTGTANEKIGTPFNANCNYGRGFNQEVFVRCGVFANDTTTRMEAGAGYYGNMELGGNLAEMTIPIGSPEGRAFTGAHGDGSLNADGSNNVTNWPALSRSSRGGQTQSAATEIRTSDRVVGVTATAEATYGSYAIRLARTGE